MPHLWQLRAAFLLCRASCWFAVCHPEDRGKMENELRQQISLHSSWGRGPQRRLSLVSIWEKTEKYPLTRPCLPKGDRRGKSHVPAHILKVREATRDSKAASRALCVRPLPSP